MTMVDAVLYDMLEAENAQTERDLAERTAERDGLQAKLATLIPLVRWIIDQWERGNLVMHGPSQSGLIELRAALAGSDGEQ